jgi:hypothetical protein
VENGNELCERILKSCRAFYEQSALHYLTRHFHLQTCCAANCAHMRGSVDCIKKLCNVQHLKIYKFFIYT